VVRFDTRGYGRTESVHVEFYNRADAAAVLDEVGEVWAHIVGLSRGGHIALDFALEYSTRTRSLAVSLAASEGTSQRLRRPSIGMRSRRGKMPRTGSAHRVRNRLLGRRAGPTT